MKATTYAAASAAIMHRTHAKFASVALFLTTACAHRVPESVQVDERTPRWAEWAARVESLPVCLPPELEAAPRELPSFACASRW